MTRWFELQRNRPITNQNEESRYFIYSFFYFFICANMMPLSTRIAGGGGINAYTTHPTFSTNLYRTWTTRKWPVYVEAERVFLFVVGPQRVCMYTYNNKSLCRSIGRWWGVIASAICIYSLIRIYTHNRVVFIRESERNLLYYTHKVECAC